MDNFIAKLKNSWKSLTNWFNTAGIVILQALLVEPTFQQYMSASDLLWVMAIGNVVLRFKTTSSLADK